MPLWAWLLTLSAAFLKFSQVITCVSSSFLLITESYTTLCTTFCLSTVWGRSGWFPCLGWMGKETVSQKRLAHLWQLRHQWSQAGLRLATPVHSLIQANTWLLLCACHWPELWEPAVSKTQKASAFLGLLLQWRKTVSKWPHLKECYIVLNTMKQTT